MNSKKVIKVIKPPGIILLEHVQCLKKRSSQLQYAVFTYICLIRHYCAEFLYNFLVQLSDDSFAKHMGGKSNTKHE